MHRQVAIYNVSNSWISEECVPSSVVVQEAGQEGGCDPLSVEVAVSLPSHSQCPEPADARSPSTSGALPHSSSSPLQQPLCSVKNWSRRSHQHFKFIMLPPTTLLHIPPSLSPFAKLPTLAAFPSFSHLSTHHHTLPLSLSNPTNPPPIR